MPGTAAGDTALTLCWQGGGGGRLSSSPAFSPEGVAGAPGRKAPAPVTPLLLPFLRAAGRWHLRLGAQEASIRGTFCVSHVHACAHASTRLQGCCCSCRTEVFSFRFMADSVNLESPGRELSELLTRPHVCK